MCNRGIIAAIVAGVTIFSVLADAGASEKTTARSVFEEQIAPILIKHCIACHDSSEHRGGLDLTSGPSALAGGDSGPVLVPGSSADSILIQRVREGTMPPPDEGVKVPPADAQQLAAWVDAGAAWPNGRVLSPYELTTDARAGLDWWSLQPLSRPAIPHLRDSQRALTPIDAFILAKLDEAGLAIAAAADRLTLIRRATFDLTGLPPMREEVEAFLADESSEAFERLVNRLLDSPHYGARWGRHWLDVVRFSESKGFERDRLRENAWRYRDWVIDAFNDDLPYDRFVRQQIAGDALAPLDPDAPVATGFLVTGPNNDVGNRSELELKRDRMDELDDFVNNTSAAFLGLTIGCARCHDHKFDPIPSRDYYRLAAVFAGVRYGDRVIATPEVQRARELELAAIDAELKPLAEKLAAVEAELNQLQSNTSTDAVAKNERIEQLTRQREEIATQQKQLDVKKTSLPPLAAAWAAVGETPQPVHRLRRGDVRTPEEQVVPGTLSAVQGLSNNLSLSADAMDADRRRALADWIASTNNPLTARVMVNRIWHYHFGAGLVDTPSDFGFNGGRPTHPELLDWLASEFIASGWSVKAMHLLMMRSAVYRQASSHDPRAAAVDAEGRLLWRYSARRLEAEAVRDAILATSGRLDLRQGGPSDRDFHYIDGNIPVYEPLPPGTEPSRRRTVYLHIVRSHASPFLEVFDCPDSSVMAPARSRTTTPLQALSLLNNDFVFRSADEFARRIGDECGDDSRQVASRAVWLVLSRPPTADEVERAAAFIERFGLAAFGRVLWNTNEFLYLN